MVGVALGLLAGCGGDVELFVPSPTADPVHQTRILAAVDDGGVEAFAFQLDDREIVQAQFTRDLAADDVQLYALDYNQSLDDFEMVGGQLFAAGPDERPCALGRPAVVRRADLRDRAVSDWINIPPADIPGAILSHLIVSDDSCLEIDLCRQVFAVQYPIQDPANIEVLVRIDDEQTLVGTRSRRFVTATSEGITARPQLDGFPGRAATVDRDGNLWLGGSGGRVVYGPPLVPENDLSIPDADGFGVEALLVTREAVVYAVALTESSTVTRIYRHDGAWSLLDEVSVSASGATSANAALAELRNGTVVAIDGSSTLWALDANGTVDRLTPPLDNRCTAVTVHPRLGVAIGTDLGFVYTALDPRSREWLRRGAPIARTVEAAGIYRDAILFGGANGILGQFHEGSVDCPLDSSVGVDLNLMAVFDEGILMGGGNLGSGSNQVAWVVLD
ncbi:MAG: hypothetical protein RIT81_27470 [Deltaproteobacteria bacterium]